MDRHDLAAAFAAGTLAFAFLTGPVAAQDGDMIQIGGLRAKVDRVIPGVGTVVIPESSIKKADDDGTRARTHHLRLIPDKPVVPPRAGAPSDSATAATTTSMAETPASLACVYRLVPQAMGCDPNNFFTVANGGTKAIGIVDAYHNPTTKADLKYFSTYFGLPAPNIKIVYCSATTCNGVTTPPPVDTGWAGEIALDVQAAHAMAPHAKIILVEAFSNSFVDLARAVDRAAELVAAEGGGQVSNSYGASDAFDHTMFDSHFVRTGVVFFASTGDHKCSGAPICVDVEWPSTSPNVVAVGGTTILRDSTTHAFTSETTWPYGGGGISTFYNRPTFQDGVMSSVGSKRGVPDIAGDAAPESGLHVRCQASSCGTGPWLQIGGTSLASPLLAGIANAANHFRSSSTTELIAIYNGLGGSKYNDIKTGKCGNGTGGALVKAVAGWDRCTGVGTPKGKNGL